MQRIAFIHITCFVCLLCAFKALAIQDKSDPHTPSISSQSLKQIADQVEDLARKQPAKAIAIYRNAIEEVNPLYAPHAYGRLLNGTAYAFYLLNEYEESMRKAKLAERIALRHELKDVLARSTMLQGNVLKQIGEYTRAINQYNEAAKYYENEGNNIYQSSVLNNIANTYLVANLIPSSIDYYKRAIKVNQLSSAYKGMGDAYVRQENYELALQNYEKGLELYQLENDSFGITMVRNGQASVYFKQGKTEKALELFNLALELARSTNQKFTLESSYRGIANTYFVQKNYEKAQVWVDQAINLATEVNEKAALLKSYELQAKIYEGQGRFREALKAMQDLRAKEQAFKTERDYIQLAVMQALFESDAKTTEINKLEEKNKLLQLEYKIEQKNSQTARFTSIVLIVALLSFSFWIYYVNSEKSRLARLSAELEKAKATAEHATKTKSAFLANMSHEIRTPLTSIIGYADSILQGDIPSQEEHRVIKIISENGNHLLHVISDILDFTKIEANKLEFEFLATPLFPLFTQIESVTGKRARDKELDFDVQFHFPLPNTIVTDPTRLRQILFNLTNNALKFTSKGSISLSVEAISNNLVISVKDTGIGIKKENQASLFTPFTQADGSINRRFGGSGLGLSISQHLANGLGGQIDFFSKEGLGSEFIVTVELKEAPGCEWVNSLEELSNDSDTQQCSADIPEYGKSKVLLAEDHPNNRELISMMLKRLDLEVTSVENGELAVKAAADNRYDLILLDIQMPIMDGIQAMKNIKKQTDKTPIIALTANNMKHEVEQYLQEGFDDHLPKPLPREELVQKLDKFLERSSIIKSDTAPEGADMPRVATEKPKTSPLSPPKDQMVGLLEDYIQHLGDDIEEALFCWQRQDWSKMLDLAHSIKGSAGGFGFTTIGLMFGEVEKHIKNENMSEAIALLDKALGEINFYKNLPHIELAHGLHNYEQDLDAFLKALTEAVDNRTDKLALLATMLETDTQEVKNYLTELQDKLTKLAMMPGVRMCQQIINNIDRGDSNTAKALLSKLSSAMTELKEYLG